MKTHKYALSITYISSNFEIVERYSCLKVMPEELDDLEKDVCEKMERDMEKALEEGHETVFASARVIPLENPFDAWKVSWSADSEEGEKFKVSSTLH